VPSEEEGAHDFLWRYHREAPRRGQLVIFNRSHYEGVVVERVKKLVPERRWQARYDQINEFEKELCAENTIVMKFFLHISKEEQRERLQERVDDARKRWKFRAGDLEERGRWDEYQAAFSDMIDQCNTRRAPWHEVPADHKWHRDLVIAEAIVERLEREDLRYPPGDPSIAGARVR
jgi:polyphosphate kinase 2 (PPK2 family)